MLGSEYQSLKELVDDNILTYLPAVDPDAAVLYDAMKYSLTAGGKRLRSVLILSFFRLADKDTDIMHALPFAEAAECIQTYSLIHDDLPAMDNDDYRRGMLTNHKVFGEDIAILAGDGLLSAASEIMLKACCDETNAIKTENKIKAALELTKGTGVSGMVQGQIADVKNAGNDCSLEYLRFIDANKTGAFIKSAVLCGCLLGSADDALMKAAEIYGSSIGTAFQIVDDILDVIGDEKELGKKTGVDAALGKSTYVGILGLDGAKDMAVRYLNEAENAVKPYEAPVAKDIIKFLREEINVPG